MVFFIKIYLFLSISAGIAVKLDDYCKHDPTNTPCATKCVRHQRCGDSDTPDSYKPLTDKEREIIVKRHNELRNAVAAGKYASSHLPACAGGMHALSYDKECEFVTACHMQACEFEHDKIRLSANGDPMGQNLYMFSRGLYKGFPENFILDGIQAWFDEHMLLTVDLIDKYRSNKGTGHLTAMLWGETKYVGCAKMHNHEPGWHNYVLYCNYLPLGNVLRSPVYKDAPCKTPTPGFDKLCGMIRPIADDTYIGPHDALLKGNKLTGSTVLWSLVCIHVGIVPFICQF